MTKLERAIKEAEQLPPEMQEQLGDDLLHYIHKYLALVDDLDEGIRALEQGDKIPAEQFLAELRQRRGS